MPTPTPANATDTDQLAALRDRKKALRKQLRQRRRQLSPLQQRQAARALFRRVACTPAFRFSSSIAFTLPRDGEISPQRLLEAALRRGKRCYLPVMSRFGADRLRFRRVRKGSALSSRNAMRIPEPTRSALCPPRALSLVLLPLVGFDARCNRLGMGKGYYDQTFAFLRHSRRRPLLIGLAHECQRVEQLETNVWDLPLHAIATDAAWYKAGTP